MAAYMEIGDIWAYRMGGDRDSYYICMGYEYDINNNLTWSLYRLEDVDMQHVYNYADETFQRVAADGTMKLESRAKENA